jgi:DNA-binding MarR family transcriptional regulator
MPMRTDGIRNREMPEVRITLDALRYIVQALRAGPPRQQPSGVSGAQLFALQQIAAQGGASINAIAARTFTHQSSVSVVIQRLVDAGLVAKVPAEDDRRRIQLTVTPKGARELARASGTVQEALVSAVARLPASDRRTLARLLTTIARAVTPRGAKGHPPMFFEGGSPMEPKGTEAAAGRRSRPRRS